MRQINSENNKLPVGAIIASACIVVYAAALVLMGIRIYVSVDQHRTVAEQEFFEIADLASSAGVLGFMDEPFVKTINDALAASGTLEGIIVSGPYGEYAFEKEKGRAVNWVNNSPRFKKNIDFSSQPLFRPLQIAGLRNANIQAVASALNYRILTEILKQSLFIILIGLSVSLFSLVMETLLTKQQARNPYEGEGSFDQSAARSNVPPAGLESEAVESTETTETVETSEDYYAGTDPGWPPAGEVIPESEAAPLEEAPPIPEEAPIPEETPIPEEAIIPEEPPEELALAPLPPVEEPAPPPAREAASFAPLKEGEGEAVTEHVPAHRDLYSPHGNICWEDNTVERLQAELRRSESFERDLALIMMEYKYSDSLGDAFYDEFAGEVVRFFTSRDMVFEKGERGVTVIFPHADLETAFLKCDEFHELVMDKLSGAFKSKTSLCAGLSTRAGRLMDAKRLIFEASESLERALADPVSHIVAFKSDPDKYRAFIASRNKKRP